MRAEAEAYFALAEGNCSRPAETCSSRSVDFRARANPDAGGAPAPHLGPAPALRHSFERSHTQSRCTARAARKDCRRTMRRTSRNASTRSCARAPAECWRSGIRSSPTLSSTVRRSRGHRGRGAPGGAAPRRHLAAGERDALAARSPRAATIRRMRRPRSPGPQFARGGGQRVAQRVDADGPVDQLAQRALDPLPPATIRT